MFCFGFSIHENFAQSNITERTRKLIDSLHKNVDQIEIDSQKTILYLRISDLYMQIGQPISSLEFSRAALELSIKSKDNLAAAYAYKNMSYSYKLAGDRANELENYINALDLFKNMNLREKQADMYRLLGQFYQMSNPEKATSYFNKSLEMYESESVSNGIADIYLNLGYLQFKAHNYDISLEYINKSIKISQKNKYYKGLTEAHINKSKIFKATQQKENEFKNINLAKKYASETNDFNDLAIIYASLGMFYVDNGDFETAFVNLNKAIDLAKSIENLYLQESILSSFAIAYKKSGNLNKAMEMLENSYLLHDSIYKNENMSKIADSQTKYDTFEIANQNRILQDENTKRNYYILILIAILIVIIIFSYLYINIKLKSTKFLEEKNSLINQQKIELVEALRKLSESEVKYRTFYDTTPVGVYTINNNGTIVSVNKAFIRILEYNTADDLPKQLNELRIKFEIVNNNNYSTIDKSYTVYESEWLTLSGKRIFLFEITRNVIDVESGEELVESVVEDVTYQKSAEKELKRNYLFIHSLLDTIPSPIFYKDINFLYHGCNQSFSEFLGKSKEEIIGKTVFDLSSYEKAMIYHQSDKELLKTKRNQVYESVVTNSKGEELNVIFFKNCFFDGDGNVAGIVGAMVNVTDLKMSLTNLRIKEQILKKNLEETNVLNKKLSESQDKIKAILDNTLQSFMLLDANMNVITFNKVAELNCHTIFKLKLKEGVIATSYFHNVSSFKHNFELSMRGMYIKSEETIISDEGDVYYFQHSYSPVFNKENQINGVLINTNDVTGRRLLNKQLSTTRARLRTIWKISNDAMIFTDSNGTIVDVNPYFAELMNTNKDHLINKRITDIYSPEMYDTVEGIYLHKFGEMNVVDVFEARLLIDGNKSLEIEGKISYITENTDKLLMLTILRDITERKRNEEKIKEFAEKLTELNNTKDKFFSIIAHDLKNPFNTLINASEVLTKKCSQMPIDKIQKYSQMIHDASQQGYGLLENLLHWSRTQTGRIEYLPANFLIYTVLRENINLIREAAESRNIELLENFDLESEIFADYDMISLIVRNLISNALKFTPDDGSIAITVENDELYTKISVADSGVGISEENINRLFRIDVNTSTLGIRGEKGTGLGLILCKEFAEKHNGFFTIKSELKKGTKFTLHIPKWTGENAL